jgi:hypothetical protein
MFIDRLLQNNKFYEFASKPDPFGNTPYLDAQVFLVNYNR